MNGGRTLACGAIAHGDPRATSESFNGSRRFRRTVAALPIRWIEATAHVHATEDEARVLAALDVACPDGPLARDALEGHFGNPIVRLVRRVERGEAIRAVWERWRAVGLLDTIAPELDARVDDEGVLHFRLDKQAAFLGTLALAKDADSIDVRVRIQAYPAKPEAFRTVARSLVGGDV